MAASSRQDGAAGNEDLSSNFHVEVEPSQGGDGGKRKLEQFWKQQQEEIESASDLRKHGLPLARIKRIMKLDEDIKMISAEAPALFAKACELFILELTMRSWEQTEESGRKTLQRADIAQTIPKADMYDFLIDIVPRDEHRPCRRGADDQLLPVHDFPQYFYQAMQHHQTQNSVSPSPSGSIGGGPSMSQHSGTAFAHRSPLLGNYNPFPHQVDGRYTQSMPRSQSPGGNMGGNRISASAPAYGGSYTMAPSDDTDDHIP